MEPTETLDGLAEIIASSMASFPLGVSDRVREDISRSAAARIIKHFGGRRLDGLRELLAERNRTICEQFNGRNHAEIAAEHGLTERQVRNIVKTCPVPGPL